MNISNNPWSLLCNFFQSSVHFIGNAYDAVIARIHHVAMSIFKAFASDLTSDTVVKPSDTLIERRFEGTDILLNRCQDCLKEREAIENVKELLELPDEQVESIRIAFNDLEKKLVIYDKSISDIKLSVLEQSEDVILGRLNQLREEMWKFQNRVKCFYRMCIDFNESRKDESLNLDTKAMKSFKNRNGEDLFKKLVACKTRLLREKIEHIRKSHMKQASDSVGALRETFKKLENIPSLYELLLCVQKMNVYEQQLSFFSSILQISDLCCEKTNCLSLEGLKTQTQIVNEVLNTLNRFKALLDNEQVFLSVVLQGEQAQIVKERSNIYSKLKALYDNEQALFSVVLLQSIENPLEKKERLA